MYSPTHGSQIWLCHVNLETDNFEQIIFDSFGQQSSYFMNHSKFTFADFTYVRTPTPTGVKSVLSVNKNIEDLYSCNYVMYQNRSYTNRYFYAFITKMEYKGENVTHLYLEEDAWQNWQFSLNYKESFIDRQTPRFDYLNTLADDVAHGQLVCDTYNEYALGGMYFAFCTTDPFQDDVKESEPYSFRVGNYNIPCWVLVWKETEYDDMTKTLQRIAANGWGDRILSCVYIPFIPDPSKIETETISPSSIALKVKIAKSINPSDLEQEIILDSTFYQPEMLKCRTFPYAKIVVTDLTSGQSLELAPEKFKNRVPVFLIQPVISETPYYRIIPKDYEGKDIDLEHTLTVQSNASLPLANNLYAKYMMNNSEMNNLQKFSSVVSGASQMLMPTPSNIIGGAMQMLTGVGTVVAKENQASKLGNSVTSIKDGAMERICYGRNRIKIAIHVMDDDHYKMCTNYWKNFGYPVRTFDHINLPLNWGDKTFVKTIICNIDGNDVPQPSLQAIKDMFNHGVFMHRTTIL